MEPRWARWAPKDYLSKTMSIPENTRSNLLLGSFETRSIRVHLSTVTIWDTFATESFDSPVKPDGRVTFPGAAAQSILLVNGTTTAVPILLRFRGSPWITTTGRRYAGSDPIGSERSAHQISPCAMATMILMTICDGTPWPETRLLAAQRDRKPGSLTP